MFNLNSLTLSPATGIPADCYFLIFGAVIAFLLVFINDKGRQDITTGEKLARLFGCPLAMVLFLFLSVSVVCFFLDEPKPFSNKSVTAYGIEINTESPEFKKNFKNADAIIQMQENSGVSNRKSKFYAVGEKLYFRKERQEKKMLTPGIAEQTIADDVNRKFKEIYENTNIKTVEETIKN